jgi:hypothetical protein
VDLECEGLRRLLQPPQGLPGLGLRSTEDDGIIRVANDGAEVTGLLGPEGVDGVAKDEQVTFPRLIRSYRMPAAAYSATTRLSAGH